MEWEYKGEYVTELPPGKVGFVYATHYSDGSYYIGKKLAASERLKTALKSGEVRDGYERVHRIIYRNSKGKVIVGKAAIKAARARGVKGKREPFDKKLVEHNWRKYEGSSDIKDSYTLVAKEILAFCNTRIAMTYMEMDLQFKLGVLFDPKCLNQNIAGKFFPGVLDGEEIHDEKKGDTSTQEGSGEEDTGTTGQEGEPADK